MEIHKKIVFEGEEDINIILSIHKITMNVTDNFLREKGFTDKEMISLHKFNDFVCTHLEEKE